VACHPRHPPTGAQIAALSRTGWLALRGKHADAAETFLRFAYGYQDGGTAWDAFPEAWRRTARDNAKAALADIRMGIGGYPPAAQLATINRPVVVTLAPGSWKIGRPSIKALNLPRPAHVFQVAACNPRRRHQPPCPP
jgi:hypothetical protein